MYFYGYYINTLLPPSLTRVHLHKAQDTLTTFSFRLWGACNSKYGPDVVKAVTSHLSRETAGKWVNTCVRPGTYTREACRAAAQDEAIHHAVQIADSPFERFTQSQTGGYIPAFSRLLVGPSSPTPTSASTTAHHSTAAPFQISLETPRIGRFRACSGTPFRLLTPASPPLSPNTVAQALETITARTQGTMMGVLERVRQEKGMPDLHSEDREMWKEVVRACSAALGGCKGRLPKGVEEKVAFVEAKLRGGTWGYALGAREQQGQVIGGMGMDGRQVMAGMGGWSGDGMGREVGAGVWG